MLTYADQLHVLATQIRAQALGGIALAVAFRRLSGLKIGSGASGRTSLKSNCAAFEHAHATLQTTLADMYAETERLLAEDDTDATLPKNPQAGIGCFGAP